MSDIEQILLHIARGDCLQEPKLDDLPLWIELFAEKLGCDPRPSAISVAIESLVSEVDRRGDMLRRLKQK